VRGTQRIYTIAALLCTLSVSAVACAVFSHFVLRLVPEGARIAAQWGVLAVTVLLEVLGVRALAIHRQVPQWWGHRYGPLAAAARYGIRMGVGPATILTSWFWWTGAILGGLGQRSVAIICGLGFALGRFATMFGLAWGQPSGVEMAHRIRLVESWRARSRIACIAVVSAAAAVAVVSAHVGR
jgi:hypothetical protein